MGIGTGIGGFWRTIRELDLGDVRARVRAPLALAIVGEPARARAVAEALLGAEGAPGSHAWMVVLPLPLDPAPLPAPAPGVGALAVVLADGPDLAADARDAVARLAAAGARVATLVLDDAAASRLGADAPRGGEAARAVLPARPAPEALARAVVAALAPEDAPDRAIALAHRLPGLRSVVVADLVEEVARANAWYAATTSAAEIVPGLNVPLVAADVVVLTKNQLIMAYRIALAAGRDGAAREVLGELVGVLGGGIFLRQVARTLVGLVPVVGFVPKVAVAYAGTRLIGAAAWHWATEGGRLPVAEARRLWEETRAAGARLAESLAARLPGGPADDGAAPDRPVRSAPGPRGARAG